MFEQLLLVYNEHVAVTIHELVISRAALWTCVDGDIVVSTKNTNKNAKSAYLWVTLPTPATARSGIISETTRPQAVRAKLSGLVEVSKI